MRKSRKPVQPRWVIDREYGVSTDACNWILLKRSTNKQGKPGGWKPVGYYATAQQLFEGFARKLVRTADSDLTMPQHVEAVYRLVTAAARRFHDELILLGLADLKRPSRCRERSKAA